jgi:hypothetical protein
MYPSGHARNTTANLEDILSHKFSLLGLSFSPPSLPPVCLLLSPSLPLSTGALAVKDVKSLLKQLGGLADKSNKDLQSIYNAEIVYANKSIDDA